MKKNPLEEISNLLAELATQQHTRLRKLAQNYVPNITDEDLLQPNDYPQLENHPLFRYEEGFLHGIQSVHSALNALLNERED
ncbi:MAG: hypothetical protein COT84_01380 [Chlamydiae bacterium CG10_big_fil_rev_8_21_14_0_10_35_9]|nr:MAG: hypothetical protein COT84_01380 [Chlamydiae bacterium CG10_big_fil_rev_8_21_14_0_10_35_9]